MVKPRLVWGIRIRLCIWAGWLIILSGCESPRVLIRPGPANPKTATDYAKWAVYYTNQGSRDGAIANYTQAIALEADVQKRCSYLLSRGACLYNQNKHLDSNVEQDISGAEKDFNEAVRLCPEDTEARLIRGTFYANTGRPERGLEDYSLLIELDPANPTFLRMRASAYAILGDLEHALTDADKAVILAIGTPSEGFFYQQRAWIRYKFGDINDTLQDLDKSVSLAKGINKCPSLLMKGAVLEERGRSTEAVKVYEQCIEEAGNVPSVTVKIQVNIAKKILLDSIWLARDMSPAGVFGVTVATAIDIMLSPRYGKAYPLAGVTKIYRDEAERRIERVKANKSPL